jgi:hypothetical protein
MICGHPRGGGLSTQLVKIFLGLEWDPGDVACPSKKSTIVIGVERFNGKALKEQADETRWRIE